jgi:hypothetical protein
MDMLALTGVLAGIAFVLTKVACRRRAARRRQPSFLLAIAGAFFTALIMMFVFYGRDLFSRRFWEDGTAPMTILVPIFFGVCVIVSLVPALLVVRHYRKKFRDKTHMV